MDVYAVLSGLKGGYGDMGWGYGDKSYSTGRIAIQYITVQSIHHRAKQTSRCSRGGADNLFVCGALSIAVLAHKRTERTQERACLTRLTVVLTTWA